MVRLTMLLVLTALTLIGAPLSCVPDTLTSYLALAPEGCRLGTRVLSTFELGPLTQGSAEIDPSAVLVTPTVAGDTGSLLFTFNAFAGGGQILESIFKMTVTPDFRSPEKVGLELTGATATGDAVVVGIGDLCSEVLIAGFCTGTSESIVAVVDAINFLPLAATTFEHSGSFELQQDIVIDAAVSGTASLSSARLTFTAVPEPTTLVTLATGLAAFVFKRRRESRRNRV